MIKVNFYDSIEDSLFKFAVIISKFNGKWVFCKHKERNTFECPGGHREENELIDETAKRELWEETGALKYKINPVCAYSVDKDGEEVFGMLYFADIYEFEKIPLFEIEKIELFDELPTEWTYPLIQPLLIKQVMKHNFTK